jgi:hypothetical protein
LYIAEQVVEIETCDVEEDIVSEEEDYTAEQVTGCYTFNAKAIAGIFTLILIALGIALYSVLKPNPSPPITTTTTSMVTPTSLSNHNIF